MQREKLTSQWYLRGTLSKGDSDIVEGVISSF